MKRIGLVLAFLTPISWAACGPMIPPPGGGPTLNGSGSGGPAGSGSAVTAGSAGDPTAGPGFPGVFALTEMKFFINNDLGIQIHADGTVEDNESDPGQPAKWQAIFKITTDGKLVGLQGNVQLGAMAPDGTFKSSHGEVAPFKFAGEALVVDDKSLTIDAQGIVQGTPANAPPLRIEGTVDAGSRRAALVVMAIAFSQGGEGGATGGGGPPPAPPTN